jgi:hypothetical protein
VDVGHGVGNLLGVTHVMCTAGASPHHAVPAGDVPSYRTGTVNSKGHELGAIRYDGKRCSHGTATAWRAWGGDAGVPTLTRGTTGHPSQVGRRRGRRGELKMTDELTTLTSTLWTATILTISIGCADAAPVISTIPPTVDHPTWLFIAILAVALTTATVMMAGKRDDGAAAASAAVADDDLSWISDDVDFRFWDAWKRRFRRSFLATRISVALMPLLESSFNPETADHDEIAKAARVRPVARAAGPT